MHMREFPLGDVIPFEKFADDLIAHTGLRWTSADPSYHRMFLHSAVARMIIYILQNFGVLTVAYRTESLGAGTISELDTFQVTPLGGVLLEALTFV